MGRKIGISADMEMGNYGDLKYAHLEHDEEKYNTNQDINHDLTKYNQNEIYVEDKEQFIEDEYEEPIRKMNEKFKKRRQYKRMFNDYDDFVERKKNDKRRKNEMYGRSRLYEKKFGTKEEKETIVNAFKELDVSEEEVLTAMSEGMVEYGRRFNEKYEGNMKLIECYTHVDEPGGVHAHYDFMAYGTDKFGKPRADVNESLKEVYGTHTQRYKDNKPEYDKNGKPKMRKKQISEIWSEFRTDTDKMFHECVEEKIFDLAKSKNLNYEKSEFYRKNGNDYKEHDKYKAQKEHEERMNKMNQESMRIFEIEQAMDQRQKLIEQQEEEMEEREYDIKQRERALEEREYELRVREDGLSEKEQGLEQKEADFDKRLKEKEESFNEMYKRPTYYAFCEDTKNSYVKMFKKKYPGKDVEKDLYEHFKINSSLVGSDGDRKIKRAKKDLSVGDEKPTVEKSKTSEKEKGFEFE
ncbi:MAG: hypothetical protein KH169_06000 [Staphylococcus epidermidis]|nr:hypothetical protein [Staphylococcus epidermidis]